MNTKFQEYEISDYQSKMKFIKGGSAIFTLKNEKTGNRFTYKVKKNSNKENDVFWVYLLCMSNNSDQKSYKFIGGYSDDKLFKHSPKAQIGYTQGVKVIEWFFKVMNENKLPKYVKMYHLSHCGRCGRRLTTPESIISGFGPECMKKEVIEGNTQPVKYLEQQEEEFQKMMSESHPKNEDQNKNDNLSDKQNSVPEIEEKSTNFFKRGVQLVLDFFNNDR